MNDIRAVRRAFRPAAFLLVVPLALLASTAAAQEGASIFTLLDPQGRRLAAGQEVEGELTERDYLAGGRRVQAWAIDGREGEALQIDMVSDVLDPYLYLAGPGLEELSDDDGGEGTNSRLCVEFPASGSYRVVASSFGGDVGSYRIRTEDRATCETSLVGGSEVTDLSELGTDGRALPWDGEATGSLSATDPASFGSPVQAWAIDGRAGETLTIDLASTDFDAYLTVLGPGLDSWVTNDDGAGGCNSRVAVTFPEDGTYRAVVSSVSGTTGAFTLASYTAPPAPQPGRCVPPSAGGDAGSETVADLAPAGSVEVGAAVTGTLSSEHRYRSRPAERWTLDAREGQQLAIEQTSDALDSYLYLQGPGFEQPAYSDDVDGTLDSRICVTIPEDGRYDIVSAGFGSGDVGPYRLAVTADPDGEICGDFLVSLRSGFARIPLEGPALEPGVEIGGSLDAATDERHPVDGSLIDVYALEAEAGESLVVDLISDQFDAYMYLVGPGLSEPIIDDDGGGRCNARIDLVAPTSGTYRVVVNSLSDAGAGYYTLRVSTEPGPQAEGSCTGSLGTTPISAAGSADIDHIRPEGRTLPMGAEVTGGLTTADAVTADGKYAQAWALDVTAGETVVVEVVSDDFDTYLYLTGPGLDGALVDDDGAAGTNSRITFTPDAAGTYRVVVSTFSGEATGAFQLRTLRRVGGGP
ncbi:MAG: PPC domain-containing protein [Longimicrobiales bacterium]